MLDFSGVISHLSQSTTRLRASVIISKHLRKSLNSSQFIDSLFSILTFTSCLPILSRFLEINIRINNIYFCSVLSLYTFFHNIHSKSSLLISRSVYSLLQYVVMKVRGYSLIFCLSFKE